MARQVWKFEPTERWVRASVDGVTVVDSKRAMLLIESPSELDYFFPEGDIASGVLIESDHAQTSGYRGVKRFWHVRANGRLIENAAWSYEPKQNRPDVSDYIALAWHKMDHWYEETEEIFQHPRNPYHRVDFIDSTRTAAVLINGVKIAESKRPLLVFETSLPLRVYFPEEDVDFSYLTTTEAHTRCPYKGRASYYTVTINGESYKNVVWTYPDPIPEAPRLASKIAFWPEKDRRIELLIDDEPYVGKK